MYLIVTADENLVKMARENGDQILVIPLEASENALNKPKEEKKKQNLDWVISEFLISLGIQVHLKGFKYLKFLLQYALDNPGFEESTVTRVVYPTCAKQFDTTPSRVERAIRHAIERGFNNKNYSDAFDNVFGKMSKQPTNDRFLGTTVLYLKEQLI